MATVPTPLLRDSLVNFIPPSHQMLGPSNFGNSNFGPRAKLSWKLTRGHDTGRREGERRKRRRKRGYIYDRVYTHGPSLDDRLGREYS